jgi:hypothetical protein
MFNKTHNCVDLLVAGKQGIVLRLDKADVGLCRLVIMPLHKCFRIILAGLIFKFLDKLPILPDDTY